LQWNLNPSHSKSKFCQVPLIEDVKSTKKEKVHSKQSANKLAQQILISSLSKVIMQGPVEQGC